MRLSDSLAVGLNTELFTRLLLSLCNSCAQKFALQQQDFSSTLQYDYVTLTDKNMHLIHFNIKAARIDMQSELTIEYIQPESLETSANQTSFSVKQPVRQTSDY